MLKQMAAMNINSVKSTSAGRLFDAVSAILSVRRQSTFEGEASTSLMFEAFEYDKKSAPSKRDYMSLFSDISITDQNHLNTNALAVRIAELYSEGNDKDMLAYAFHDILSMMIATECFTISKFENINTVALSGGVFQNILLLKLTKERLNSFGLNVLTHSLIPPNDGGIALGQALYGMFKINN